MKKLIIALCFLATSLFAASHNKEVTIKTTKVTKGIYLLQGKGGNIAISVGNDGIFMIDDKFAPMSKDIKDEISKISKKEVKFLINTHWHGDHTGGNANFAKDGIVIVSHENVRKRMSKDNFIIAFNKTIKASRSIALPMLTFNDSMNFHMNNEDIEIIHLNNAHTDGDSIVFFKNSNVLHTGDIFFNGFYPYIDESSEGSVKGIIKAVDYILSIVDDKTKIIPGHGKLANKKDLLAYKRMLTLVSIRMEKLISENKTLEEVLALKPNADIDEEFGKGFLNPEKFLSILYSLIKASK